MIFRWGDFLKQLKPHGVTLETTEYEAIDDEGNRITAQFLVRWLNGKPKYHVVEIERMSDPVPKYMVRRIAIALDLPPGEFILPDDPL